MSDIVGEAAAVVDGHNWIDYEGYRFRAPYICMCCGCEVEVRQWAFGRCCGFCDSGACQRVSRTERHEKPKWLRGGREASIFLFAMDVGGEKLGEQRNE